MSILYINSSARGEQSNSNAIGNYLIERLSNANNNSVIQRDLGSNPLPAISGSDLIGVHGSQDLNHPSFLEQLAISNSLIDELKQVDTLVISTAMYNFNIPVVLKQWIDAVCRAGVSFNYTPEGPKGLLAIERAFVITASGGTPIGSPMDFASPYLEHVLRFIGVNHVHHIAASGSKQTPEETITAALQDINKLLDSQAA